jgi:hypothetical protein
MSLAGSEIAIIRNPVLSTEKSRIFSQKRSLLKTKIKYFKNFYLLIIERVTPLITLKNG